VATSISGISFDYYFLTFRAGMDRTGFVFFGGVGAAILGSNLSLKFHQNGVNHPQCPNQF
jgi:hypothetical protein